MMHGYSMKKMLTVIWCMVLIAAMALNFTGCGSKPAAETPATGPTVTFHFTVTDLDGKETAFDITTSRTMVGEALEDEGLIEGDPSEYGMYVRIVNGITADWDKDQTYWAFYINGEYAMTGVDVTEIDPACTYSFVLTKG